MLTSNVTSVTEVRSVSSCLFVGTWRPLVSVITSLYYMLNYVATIVFIVECGIARFLCAMRIFEVRHHPHPIATFVAHFVSFAASIPELAHGEQEALL